MTTIHIGRGCRRCAWRGWRLAVGPLGFDFVPCRWCSSRWPWRWILGALAVLVLAALCGWGGL